VRIMKGLAAEGVKAMRQIRPEAAGRWPCELQSAVALAVECSIPPAVMIAASNRIPAPRVGDFDLFFQRTLTDHSADRRDYVTQHAPTAPICWASG